MVRGALIALTCFFGGLPRGFWYSVRVSVVPTGFLALRVFGPRGPDSSRGALFVLRGPDSSHGALIRPAGPGFAPRGPDPTRGAGIHPAGP